MSAYASPVRWRELRAGLIAFAILLAFVEGCPIPPPDETLPWQQGYVSLIRPVQQAVMKPFAWVPRTLRFSQRWALFQAADPDRFRLEVIGRGTGGQDRLLFRAGDPDHDAYATLITQRRIRGTWNPTAEPPGQYRAFAWWLAQRVFADHPDIQIVWLRFERVHIEDGVPRGTGRYAFDQYVYRGRR